MSRQTLTPTSTTFVVPMEPVGQPRQRFGIRNGQVRPYQDSGHSVQTFKRSVKYAAIHARAPKLLGPVKIEVVCVFARPKNIVWKRKPMPRLWKATKPDTDNVMKAVLDALKGVAWRDDAQVCDERCVKVYAAGDERPHVAVTIGPAGSLSGSGHSGATQ